MLFQAKCQLRILSKDRKLYRVVEPRRTKNSRCILVRRSNRQVLEDAFDNTRIIDDCNDPVGARLAGDKAPFGRDPDRPAQRNFPDLRYI